jgi:hypothetical protein
VYKVETDEQAQHQIDALPARALACYAELRTPLEIALWNGSPINNRNPDAAVRVLTFGPHREGMVTYLVLEDQRRIDVLQVIWLR